MHPQLSYHLAEAHQAELASLAERHRLAKAGTSRPKHDQLTRFKSWRTRRAATLRLVFRRERLAI